MIIKQTRDTLSQIYKDALNIRYTVFVNEQQVPYAMELESPVEEAAAIHFVAYTDKGQLIGTVRLLPKPDQPNAGTLQRMAVLPDFRGKGYAGKLMSALIDFAVSHDYTTVFTHAQLTARGLYEKFGFIPYGNEFEEAGIRHISMKKRLN